MTDPIADMLTRIRNANTAKLETVEVPMSNIKLSIAQILEREGYVKKVEVVGEDVKKNIVITMNVAKNKEDRALTGIKRISKPGLRVYASKDKDIDILEGQIRKWKTKKDKSIKEDSIKNLSVEEIQTSPTENEIIKTVFYDLKPITPEDAMLKLQEKPADKFITFINSETNKVNVLFRLKDNKNFGIVEPDL